MGVRKANADVFEISSTRVEHKGMGSTIVAMSISRDTSSVQIAHVGDSRCYRIRDGKIEQLTRDHSLIGDALAWNPNLSEEELSMLPKNIISRALGLKQAVEVDIRSDPGLPGDIYLLCSDGLCGVVKDKQILEIIQLSNDLADACDGLIALANDAGGPDNITAVAVRLEAAGVITASGPEILISVVGEDEIPIDESGPISLPTNNGRTGVVCEKCGRRATGTEVYCGQCGARIAL
jgi:protein phosphatase